MSEEIDYKDKNKQNEQIIGFIGLILALVIPVHHTYLMNAIKAEIIQYRFYQVALSFLAISILSLTACLGFFYFRSVNKERLAYNIGQMVIPISWSTVLSLVIIPADFVAIMLPIENDIINLLYLISTIGVIIVVFILSFTYTFIHMRSD